MRLFTSQITFQEIPDEICLSLHIAGCPLRCEGCHSSDAWAKTKGTPFAVMQFRQILDRYAAALTCVVFLGGEWHETELVQLLAHARSRNLKTALYTGLDDVSEQLKSRLDYLKTGRWLPHRGGLDSPNTNQRLIDLQTGKLILPKQQGGGHDKTDNKPSGSKEAFC